ncbi:MAG: hypothetical protein GY832_27150 [Chloroflexi bacterium]|nr:hypothetical protein [Chloroflexota bacterium]
MSDIVVTKVSSSEPNSTFPLRMLRWILPVLMPLMLLGGILEGIGLALILDQPFPGIVMMWRKELKLLTVSWATPAHWPGIGSDKLQINDRILCIDGYHPNPDSPIYGLDPRYAEILCPKGPKRFELFYERFNNAQPALVEFIVDRDNEIMIIPGVPLVRFTLTMLLEIFLPSFLVILGLLAVGFVVYYANPGMEINLTFALFVTIIAGLATDLTNPGHFSDQITHTRITTLLLNIPWIPLLGAVMFHWSSLLTDQDRLLSLVHRLRRPYYILSLAFSLLGLVVFGAYDTPIDLALSPLFLSFVAISCSLAIIWSLASLALTWCKTSSRRVRRQAGLILLGLMASIGFVAPFVVFNFSNIPTFRYAHITPYLILVLVATIAYAILRYQLFGSKAKVLTFLLVAIWCILSANLVYLVAGQVSGFLPILAATLLASFGLLSRWGPTAFFNRLLRREMIDYQIVAHFSQRVGSLQQIGSLLLAAQSALQQDMDLDHVHVWLLDPEHQTLERFREGEFVGSMPLPPDLVKHLIAVPLPVHASSSAASDYNALLVQDEPDAVALWAPLVDRGQAVGVLGLGPRWTGEVYDEPDLQLVGILARQMALAILNTRQLERLQAMSRLVIQAEENERLKIAQELHDTILQFLLVLTYGLDDLRERQAEIADEIEHWQDRISVEANQLREMLSYLRAPEVLVKHGLVTAFQAWIERVRQDTDIPILTKSSPDVEHVLLVEAQVAIYRVFREAIHNALKHSQANQIVVQLEQDADCVRFSIRDDGQGFDVEQILQSSERGYSSLRDIRAYIENVDGELHIHSEPGAGTLIGGQVPISVE